MSTSRSQQQAVDSELSQNFHVAHHFDKADTQFASNKMGVWIFLVTEILFFGGLFCAFAVYRSWYYDAFVQAHHHLDKIMGAANTMVLILSSLTMALAVRAAQTNNKKQTIMLLLVTLICAGIFLCIKYVEYSHKIHDGLLPFMTGEAPNQIDHFTNPHLPKESRMFFAIYFMMTGVHGLHVLIGMGLITWILIRAGRGEFSSRYYSPVEGVGLYWHLVDMVWIYLFPLLYLVGS